MKKIVILIFTLICLKSNGQFYFVKPKNYNYDNLKTRTLLVPLAPADTALARKFKYVFEKYWTYSKFKFVKPSEVDRYKQNLKYYYFEFISYIGVGDKSGSNTYFLNLKAFMDKGKRNPTDVMVSSYDLFYKDGIFVNLTPGILKLYITLVQQYMENPDLPRMDIKTIDKTGISDMKKSTLYFPDYVLFKRNVIGLNITATEAEVFADFPGKYKVLPSAEFDDLILNATEPTYVYVYVINHLVYVTIWDAQSNKMIYNVVDAPRALHSSYIRKIYNMAP